MSYLKVKSHNSSSQTEIIIKNLQKDNRYQHIYTFILRTTSTDNVLQVPRFDNHCNVLSSPHTDATYHRNKSYKTVARDTITLQRYNEVYWK
jgi:hypothetical protein